MDEKKYNSILNSDPSPDIDITSNVSSRLLNKAVLSEVVTWHL